MVKKAKDKGERATFDFSHVGRTWSTEFRDSMTRGSRAQELLNREFLVRPPRAIDADADDDEVEAYEKAVQAYADAEQAYYDRREEAVQTMATLPDEQAKLIVQVLASVPREWLRQDAPEQLDWSDVANLDYITPPGYGKILEMIMTGDAMNSVRESAKN